MLHYNDKAKCYIIRIKKWRQKLISLHTRNLYKPQETRDMYFDINIMKQDIFINNFFHAAIYSDIFLFYIT